MKPMNGGDLSTEKPTSLTSCLYSALSQSWIINLQRRLRWTEYNVTSVKTFWWRGQWEGGEDSGQCQGTSPRQARGSGILPNWADMLNEYSKFRCFEFLTTCRQVQEVYVWQHHVRLQLEPDHHLWNPNFQIIYKMQFFFLIQRFVPPMMRSNWRPREAGLSM